MLVRYAGTDGVLQGWAVGGGIAAQTENRQGNYLVKTPDNFSIFLRYAPNHRWSFQVNGDAIINGSRDKFIVGIGANGLVQVADVNRYRGEVMFKF